MGAPLPGMCSRPRQDETVGDFFDRLSINTDGLRASRALPHVDEQSLRWLRAQMDRMARYMYARLPSEGHLLDVGCGAGEFYSRLPGRYKGDYVGVDIARGMLDLFEREKSVCVPRQLFHGDLGRLPLPVGHFTFSTMVGVMIYVPEEDHGRLISRVYELMAVGGTLMVDIFNNRLTGEESNLVRLARSLADAGFAITGMTAFASLPTIWRRPWNMWSCADDLLRMTGIYSWPWWTRRFGHRVFFCAGRPADGAQHDGRGFKDCRPLASDTHATGQSHFRGRGRGKPTGIDSRFRQAGHSRTGDSDRCGPADGFAVRV